MVDREVDQALFERLRAGDMSACTECVELHSADLLRLSRRILRDDTEAQDVVQETFLNAFRGIKDFDGRATLSTWLYRIAYNLALARLRRPQPVLVSVEDEGDEALRHLVDTCCLPESTFDDAEARSQLEQAIGELPGKLKAVFILRQLEGLSTEEVAEALGLSTENVKVRLYRARTWLRGRLAGYFDEGAPATR
jgi:RNA polymerase sigma-70 factor, ECF subfamily